jgi:DNA-binding response OmpR family regulator
MRILVVEDEKKMALVIKRILNEYGYVVDISTGDTNEEEQVRITKYDLLIIDVMLPKQSGLELCMKAKLIQPATPILILSALDAADDKVSGLESGADDYMSKPFEAEELIARVRALLRRGTELKKADVLMC